MSDTPRTDARLMVVTDNDTCKIKVLETVRAPFVRILEREVNALTAERDQLRAEVERLKDRAFDKDGTPWKTICGWWSAKYYDAAERQMGENAARAERAEDNLAALEQCHDDNCRSVVKIAADLATEQARLDWLLLDVVSRFDDAYYTRATIDAKMQKDAK